MARPSIAHRSRFALESCPISVKPPLPSRSPRHCDVLSLRPHRTGHARSARSPQWRGPAVFNCPRRLFSKISPISIRARQEQLPPDAGQRHHATKLRAALAAVSARRRSPGLRRTCAPVHTASGAQLPRPHGPSRSGTAAGRRTGQRAAMITTEARNRVHASGTTRLHDAGSSALAESGDMRCGRGRTGMPVHPRLIAGAGSGGSRGVWRDPIAVGSRGPPGHRGSGRWQ
jgi:hypothetical protein